VKRSKNGLSVEQPMAGDELRLLKRYLHIKGKQFAVAVFE
jgi:hypothetical protein